MKSILLLLSLLFGSHHDPVESVRALQGTDLFGYPHNICTTESIHAKQGYWLVANHCVLATGMFGEPLKLTIDGKEVWLVKVDGVHDVAILQGPKGVPALHFAKHPPKSGDEIYMIGHPIGIDEPQFFFGHISSAKVKDSRKHWAMLFDIEGCHGNSGSAILNKQGEVVSVLQFLVADYDQGQSCGHWLGGLLYSDLITFVQGYAEHM